MQGLILKDNAWHLIEQLPDEPKPIKGDVGNLCYISLRRDYEHLILSNAVRVENQEVAEQIAKKEIDTLMLSHAMPDEAYPVEVDYEIIDACKFNHNWHACKDVINDFDCFYKVSCQARKLARLIVSIDQLDAESLRKRIKEQDARQFKALLDWHEEKHALELRIKDLEAEIERLKPPEKPRF